MSFGAVQSAISSLKNNRNLVSKRKKLKNGLVKMEGAESIVFEHKASPEKLNELRLRLQKERKERRLKTLIIFSIFMLLLITVIAYFF
ncbi:hypothetical protein [Bizionia arctica]|uniref:Uncharacterized protein n=1 Tax=Bizionia arctica TaxID=1495645 RepID=A0A917GE70_9FLAO|nr:hypothetical protein [Bizionia arctica]GGG41139.1 hypothetical protein GCM10010976_10930 [Bizionia arctica]